MSRSERALVAVVCESDYPAAWMDSAAIELHHDESDPFCGCRACGDLHCLQTRLTTEWLLADYAAVENDNYQRSVAPTSKPPRMSDAESLLGEVE